MIWSDRAVATWSRANDDTRAQLSMYTSCINMTVFDVHHRLMKVFESIEAFTFVSYALYETIGSFISATTGHTFVWIVLAESETRPEAYVKITRCSFDKNSVHSIDTRLKRTIRVK